MTKVLRALIGAAAVVACVYLVKFEFAFSFPAGDGRFEYKFKYGK